MPGFELLIGDCREKLRELPSNSIDLVITSPPYKRSEGYSAELMRDTAHALRRVMKESGRLWINFGQLKEDFRRPFEVEAIFSLEFVTAQTRIWAKSMTIDGFTRGHYTPINSKQICYYGFEFIFQFVNGNPSPLNCLSIGVPYTDEGNLKRDSRGKNGNCHCPGDILNVDVEDLLWFIPYETTGKTKKKGHDYQFPEELVRRLLLLSNLEPGAIVLDPFAGSGTVAKVANELGFNAVSIELDKDKVVYVGPA